MVDKTKKWPAISEKSNRRERVSRNKEEVETNWHEKYPQVALDLIAATNIGMNASVVDVDAGASRLVACLLKKGFHHVTVLDLLETALAKARARLNKNAPADWVVDNVLQWKPARRFKVWHDRAAFHFLTEMADQETYLQVIKQALLPGDYAIIGTFTLDDPTSCSNLPARYAALFLTERSPSHTVASLFVSYFLAATSNWTCESREPLDSHNSPYIYDCLQP